VASERDWLRCYLLEAGNQPQAALLAFHWRHTASFYQMGWNPDGGVQSPGVVLLAHSIEQAIREGLTTYDFLRGEEAYKWKWTTRFVEQTTLVVGRRMPARAVILAERFKNSVKHAIQHAFGPEKWERLKGLVGAGTR
jgi:CelD/BcsL family acetyltransferase involved in cellulose biosynthesis